MTQKIKLGILCGGESAEHEVSIISVKNIVAALDLKKYKILVIYITKAGKWFLFSNTNKFLQFDEPSKKISQFAKPVAMTFGEKNKPFITINPTPRKLSVDVVFPVLHGPRGEDGTVQGMLDLAGVPYVGAGNLSSAMCMDKEITKRLLEQANLPTPKWLAFTKREKKNFSFKFIENKLGLPFFLKPANMGSSVGISKVKSQADFNKAIMKAFRYDQKIIVEECIVGRELECAVLGNAKPKASKVAEIIPQDEFYTYEAKYINPHGAILKAPVKLPKDITKKIQALAVDAFRVLNCAGMARVDFFLDKRNRIYISELNTIPGFTKISMYPRLWLAQGLGYGKLLDELIRLALQKHAYK